MRNVCLSQQDFSHNKHMLVKYFVTINIILSTQMFCGGNHTFVTTTHVFVTTKMIPANDIVQLGNHELRSTLSLASSYTIFSAKITLDLPKIAKIPFCTQAKFRCQVTSLFCFSHCFSHKASCNTLSGFTILRADLDKMAAATEQ